jgi:hypothetical protein
MLAGKGTPQEPKLCEQTLGSSVVFAGRFVTGPVGYIGVGTIALMVVPSVFAHVTVLREPNPWLSVLVRQVLATVFLACSLASFVSTNLSDPGIFPRLREPITAFDAARGEYRVKSPPRQIDVVSNGFPVRLKFCTTCNIYRPPRTVHCRTCDNCVQKFDHHCPWVGNCIGLRNYRSFCTFIVSISALLAWTTLVALCVLLDHWWNPLYEYPGKLPGVSMRDDSEASILDLAALHLLEVLLICYCQGFFAFTFGLTAFHSYLMLTGRTTYEALTDLHTYGSPFFLGWTANITQVLCGMTIDKLIQPSNRQVRWPPKGTKRVPLETPRLTEGLDIEIGR